MNKSKLTDWQKKDATRYKVIAMRKLGGQFGRLSV
jgi:hypothetical protein